MLPWLSTNPSCIAVYLKQTCLIPGTECTAVMKEALSCADVFTWPLRTL